jgi:hypothetical protein
LNNCDWSSCSLPFSSILQSAVKFIQ